MTKLTNDEYVAELNRRLMEDPDVLPGTRFVAIAPDADAVRQGGSTWEGPDEMLPVIVRVVKETAGMFEIEHPFVAERG
ncbi:MAG: hypothetical protein JWP52_3148 [Rhizobacter sp.]|jgi:hypothetical protein|nr:hypothetical protein [Rhizobacter sp.]